MNTTRRPPASDLADAVALAIGVAAATITITAALYGATTIAVAGLVGVAVFFAYAAWMMRSGQ